MYMCLFLSDRNRKSLSSSKSVANLVSKPMPQQPIAPPPLKHQNTPRSGKNLTVPEQTSSQIITTPTKQKNYQSNTNVKLMNAQSEPTVTKKNKKALFQSPGFQPIDEEVYMEQNETQKENFNVTNENINIQNIKKNENMNTYNNTYNNTSDDMVILQNFNKNDNDSDNETENENMDDDFNNDLVIECDSIKYHNSYKKNVNYQNQVNNSNNNNNKNKIKTTPQIPSLPLQTLPYPKVRTLSRTKSDGCLQNSDTKLQIQNDNNVNANNHPNNDNNNNDISQNSTTPSSPINTQININKTPKNNENSTNFRFLGSGKQSFNAHNNLQTVKHKIAARLLNRRKNMNKV